MDVQITDSFTKSLKKLMWHQHWLYKTYSVFRYSIPLFLKNIWRFRKELWKHEWWDYRFTLNMLERSLTIMEAGMSTKGMEVTETREPKVKSMRRAIEILQNNKEDNYIDRAEKELGELIIYDWEFEDVGEGLSRLVDKTDEVERVHNRKVFDRAREIEETEWNELWDIFKGTGRSKKVDENYDGTDMRGWWD